MQKRRNSLWRKIRANRARYLNAQERDERDERDFARLREMAARADSKTPKKHVKTEVCEI